MKIEIITITSTGELKHMLPDWKEFLDRDDVSCGFWCDPDVIMAQYSVDDNHRLIIAEVSDGDRTVAYLPFRFSLSNIPYKVGLIKLGSAERRVLRLFDGEFAVATGADRLSVLSAVISRLFKSDVADILIAPNVCLNDAFAVPSGWLVRNRQQTYLVDGSLNWNEYQESLKTKTRQTIRRKIRKLEKQGDLQLLICRESSQVTELHRLLTEVWKKSWHFNLGRQKPPSVKFLNQIAGIGFLRSYVLYSGEKPVASVLGFQYRGTFYEEAPAYDMAFQKLSPGLVLNWMMLENLFTENKPKLIDYGFGYNQYKEVHGHINQQRGEIWIGCTRRGKRTLMLIKLCDGCFILGRKVLGGRIIKMLKERRKEK